MVTIKDLASITGLSIGTISNYINGKPIKEANREKIRAAIEETGYTPNYFGRSLKTKKTKTIGVVTYNISSHFVSEVYNILERRLAENGYDVYFCNSHGSLELEKEKLQFLVNHGADAIVLFPKSYENSSIEITKKMNIPTVLVDNIIKDEKCSHIVFDDENAAYIATQHLIRNGHKKIACLTGYNDYFTTTARINGYTRALKDNGIEEQIILQNLVDRSQHTNATIEVLQEHPDVTAFLITSSTLLIGFLTGLKTLQLSVPNDISYITFDDADYYDLLTVTPTYIFQDKEHLGNSIYDILSKIINDTDSIITQTISTHLVFGNSVKNLLANKNDPIFF